MGAVASGIEPFPWGRALAMGRHSLLFERVGQLLQRSAGDSQRGKAEDATGSWSRQKRRRRNRLFTTLLKIEPNWNSKPTSIR